MLRTSKVARNIATTFLTQVISWVLSFAVILFLPHYAGVSGFGMLTLAGSFAGIFALISSVGTSIILIRDIPRNPESAGKLILGALILRLPLAILSIGLAEVIGRYWFNYDNKILAFVAISLAVTAVSVVSDTISSAFRGLESFTTANVGTVVDKFIISGVTILVCLMKWPLWVIVAAPLLSSVLSSAYMLRQLLGLKLDWTWPDRSSIISLAKAGLPFVSAGVFVAIYGRTDAIFLSKMSTIQSIGWYALGNRVAGTAMSLPTVVCAAMLPNLSGLYRSDRAAFIDGAARLTNLMVICCIPISAVMIFCPQPIVSILSHNTASFAPAADVVRICGGTVMLWFISQATFSSIVACDQQKIIGSSMGIAAVIGVPITAGCIYLTQHFYHNGATGAAWSDLLTEVYLVACYCKALPAGVVSLTSAGASFRAVLAAIPMVAIVCLVPIKYALLSAVPGAVIYGGLCLAFKCLHPSDMALFTRLVAGKFRAAKK